MAVLQTRRRHWSWDERAPQECTLRQLRLWWDWVIFKLQRFWMSDRWDPAVPIPLRKVLEGCLRENLTRRRRELAEVSSSPPKTAVCLKYELWQITSQIVHHSHILTYRELKWMLWFLARTEPAKYATGFCQGTDIWCVGIMREIHSSLREGVFLQCYYVQRAIVMKQFWIFNLDLLRSTKLSDINASNDRNKTLSLIMHLVYWIRIIGRLRGIHWRTLCYKISHVFEHLYDGKASPGTGESHSTKWLEAGHVVSLYECIECTALRDASVPHHSHSFYCWKWLYMFLCHNSQEWCSCHQQRESKC